MNYIHRVVATPKADTWDIWRYVLHTTRSQTVWDSSPDRIIATCDRYDDAFDIAEFMNVREDEFA